jgi:hydrogenase-4 component E
MMGIYLNLLSALILISAFILVSNKRVRSYIKTFRFQSGLLALLAIIMGINQIRTEGSWDIFIIGLLTIAVKYFYIPNLLTTAVKRLEYPVEKDFFLNIPVAILICCGLVVLTHFVISRVDALVDPEIKGHLVNSVTVVLIGLFFMITRKRAIGQIIGLLVLENGLFTAAILSTRGMPMIVELGIFFDLLAAVLIMGILVFRINATFETIDIDKLKNLKG